MPWTWPSPSPGVASRAHSEMERAPLHIGISTKAYLSYAQSLEWLEAVLAIARSHPAVRDGIVRVFLAPSTPLLESAVRISGSSPVSIAAQDVSRWEAGAYTGETVAPMLAEMGVTMVELGHAERRSLLGETDEVIREKAARVEAAGMRGLLCVGETERLSAAHAAATCLEQARASGLAAPLLAYEPVWAIGAAEPAPAEHVRAVIREIKAAWGTRSPVPPVIYGGSAGPGLLARLLPDADGLFLGRFAHDPRAVRTVLDEAARSAE
ncbi:triosephosphate isomerase [Clavibacter sp. B3I6]|uniref:triose-phosphate isomerase family protein n=1 Tax=Clavibacter sp. B3I6 TaxID=3042268 RepID=UPI002782DD6F|nr:triose-phosphate isomerase family protein [Clavibacter sp. B3I6]MDQ0744141.1 triosephosphate isomerase [Clavibacter sp. B3I6]